jgi:ribose transport system substrate-binding protein
MTGCANSGASDDNTTIGFSVQKLSNQFQLAMIADAQANAEEAGVTLMEPTNADADPAKQTTDIQTILTQAPDSLIISPVDAKAVVPSVTKANQANVPVISIDEAPGGGEVYMVVRADNVGMGETACQSMGETLGGTGTVLELQGDLASTNGRDRSEGFQSCMKENFPDIKIVSQPTDWALDKATAAVQTVASTQSVDGVFMASDYFVPSVQKTLQSLGQWKPAGEDGHVALVGIDGEPAALDLIRQGYQDSTVSQPANAYAEWAVKYAIAAANGETFSPGATDHDSEIVEVDTGLADLLTAPLVTKDNVDDETLWGNTE